MTKPSSFLLFLLIVLIGAPSAIGLLACESDSSTPTQAGGSTSSSGGSDGSTSSDAGSSGDPGGPQPYTLKPVTKRGGIILWMTQDATDYRLSINGSFRDQSAAPASAEDGFSLGKHRATDCVKRSAGSCDLVRCKLVEDPSFELVAGTSVSAGEITVKRADGTELKSSPVGPPGDASYSAELQGLPAGAAGEALTVSATGADVPAFAESLVWTTVLTLKTPSTVSALRGNDVKVEWSGYAKGKVRVVGTSNPTNNVPDSDSVVGIDCSFDASAGSGTIPAALVGDEIAGRKLNFGVYPKQLEKMIGEYLVTFEAVLNNGPSGGGFVLEVQ